MIKRYPNTFNGQVMERWGILWRSNNRLDGLREHLVHDGNREQDQHEDRRIEKKSDAAREALEHLKILSCTSWP
jgi:hypothetical protein